MHQVCRQHLIDLRCEISLRGQQPAHLGFGQLQQAQQFNVIQIRHLLVALELQKALHQRADVLRRLNPYRKRLILLGVSGFRLILAAGLYKLL